MAGSSSAKPNPAAVRACHCRWTCFPGVMRRELPAGPGGDRLDADRFQLFGDLVRLPARHLRHQHLGGAKPRDLIEDLPFRSAGGDATSGGEFDPRQRRAIPAGLADSRRDGSQVIVAAAVEQRIVGERARRHEPDDFALDDPFGRGRIFHLLADRHAMPGRDHLPQITFDRMKRHAGHRNRVFGAEPAPAAAGQGDAQRLGRELRVLPEHLVKIPHPKEQDIIGILLLECLVLLHRRRVGAGAIGGCWGVTRRLRQRRLGHRRGFFGDRLRHRKDLPAT